MKGLAGKKKALWRMHASHNKGRRILAIVTSFFLIGGMLNIPRKAQARNTSADEYQLITEMYYDATNPNNVYRQENATKALSTAAVGKAQGLTLPLTDLANDSEVIKAFNADGSRVIQSVEVYAANPSLAFGDTPLDNYPSIVSPGDQYINTSGVGDTWSFSILNTVTSAQMVTANVLFGKVQLKCTYQDATYAVSAGPITLSKNYDASYVISLNTAQNHDKELIKDKIGTKEITTEIGVKKSICTLDLTTYAGYVLTTTADNRLGFTAVVEGSDGSHTLTMTACPNSRSPFISRTVTVDFNLPSDNAPAFTITIKFERPDYGKIILSDSFPFREEVDQKEALSSPGLWKMEKTGDDIPADDWVNGKIPIKDENVVYPSGVDGESDFPVTVSWDKDQSGEGNAFWEKYQCDSSSKEVTINKIESRGVTSLSEKQFLLTNADQSKDIDLVKAPDSVGWANWDAPLEFKYNGHQLSSKTDAGFSFADLYQVNDTQGKNIVEAVYAKDNTSKIIEKITDITYKYDITPPKPINFTVSDPDFPEIKDAFDFWLFDKSAHMTVDVTDKNSQDPSIDVAGLKPEGGSEGNSLSYYDKHGERTMDGGLCTLSADGVSGQFNFNIDGDQQTDIKGSTKVHLVDNAGNVYDGGLEGATNIPENVRDLVIQSGNPSLSLNWIEGGEAHHGSYYNQNRRAVFTITMPAFEYLKEADPDQVIITITTGDKNSGYAGGNTVYVTAKQFAKLSNQYVQDGKDEFSYVAYFDRETDYKINTQITSLLPQYAASLPEETFTIDKTAPVLNVSFDNNNVRNGKYYNASRTATVTIAEHNFDPSLIKLQVTSTDTNGAPAGSFAVSGWSNSGDMHTATVNFPQDGTYQIQEISGTDLADNAMATYGDSSFVIDTQKPTIALSVNGETDAASHAYKDGAPLSISLDDTNIDPSSTIEVVPVGLNSQANPYASAPTAAATHVEYAAASPAVTAENDNLYRATIHAVDLAGNEDTKTCEWSVNRFGSVYTVNQETKNMLDKQYIKGSDATDATIIEINPSGIDQSSAKVNISNGANNTDLQNGSGFQLNTANWDNLPAYNYVIPKANFANDGTYQITVQSHDLAGNASSNTMDNRNLDRTNSQSVIFAIDNTAPVVSFSGFNEYEVPEPTHDVTIKVEDNIALDKAVLKMSDGTETTLSADEFNPTSHNATITLHETGAPQQVEVRAYDKAGNMNPEYSPSIVVSTNPFVLWANNPIIVAITIVALLCIIAAAAYYIRRKKLSEAE